MDDEGLETSTASDDSVQGPWTVVTSPSHARKPSDDASPSHPTPLPQVSEAAPQAADAAEAKSQVCTKFKNSPGSSCRADLSPPPMPPPPHSAPCLPLLLAASHASFWVPLM